MQHEQNYLKVSSTEQKWREIAKDFEDRWNFPHCLGAIDGKHINMQAPANSGCLYFNYKKSFSIVLLAVCNGNYQFTMLDIGESGRQSDGGVFAKSNIGICIKNQSLDFPEPEKLRHCDAVLPYVFIGDDAFPMGPNLMKPYPRHNLDDQSKIIANYRLSRARRIIENSFGILAARFRIF